jgi:hypothetical protein
MDRSEKLKKSLAALFISLFMMVFAMAEFYFIRIGY